MAAFPILKTGAVAQYPSLRATRFQTTSVRFLDGSEQRFRQQASPLRAWVIKLDALDDQELSNVEAFVAAQDGRHGTFEFTDPWDQTVYPSCSLEEDTTEFEWSAINSGRTRLRIRENRS